MAEFAVRPRRGRASGDAYFEALGAGSNQFDAARSSHPLESEGARAILRQLLQWYYFEKERQAANRLEMAMDCDFYDNLQWDAQDAAILRDRGQMPLVYNEVAPMVDWLIGTERRSRVDWRVLPRSEDDVEAADVKTKLLKYVSDINRVSFLRSRAFADAIKAGVGWMDDGARDDPTQDILYSRYEDWRHVLWDASSDELDLSDARYLFRWRWVDEDVARLMFPDRSDVIAQAIEEAAHSDSDGWEEENWQSQQDPSHVRSGTLYALGVGELADAKRRRVKLIEAQYRAPAKVKVVAEGPWKGSILHPRDTVLQHTLDLASCHIIERVMMRVHLAVFTPSKLLAHQVSPYRHNRFTLTPIWCYRKSRDRLPYGVIRRVRDVQQDLNKRASKALFMLNTNQVIADEGAVDDWDVMRDEVDRPDGVIIKKSGRELEIRRDTEAANGQIEMMQLAATSIQKSAGVAQENMGRQTNAVSGEAIKARQLQGSVVTTEPFDNLRLATQVQGEKQLSLIEQWYTDAKVIRLTGAKNAIEWVKVNTPEVQADGSVRVLNDITASMADFVVSEQDYAGTLRQVMFENLNQLAARFPPEIGLRVMTIAMDFSDLPNKDEIANQFRKLTGERDPSKPPSGEEEAQAQAQAMQQAQALELQRQMALAALDEQRAKVRETNAKAAKLEAEVAAMGATLQAQGLDPQEVAMREQALRQDIETIKAEAATEIDRVSEALRKAQMDLASRTLQIREDANTKLEVARIDADSKERVAQIQAVSDEKLAKLQAQLDELSEQLKEGEGGHGEKAQEKPKAEKAKPKPREQSPPQKTSPQQKTSP